MMDEDCVYVTQCCNVRGLSKKQYNVLVDVSLKLNILRNCVIDKTYLFKSSDGVHYEKINFKPIIKKVKQEFNKEYKSIRAHLANSTICKHVDSFNAYVALKNKSIDEEYDCRVNMPGKHDENRLHNIIIPKKSITSSKKKLKVGYTELPLSREYKKGLESPECRPRIKIPENIRDEELIQVEIIPIDNGKFFRAHFTYKKEKEPMDLDEEKIMGIDLGVNNFATIVTTEGTPYTMDGKFLKNQIYFKCKKK